MTKEKLQHCNNLADQIKTATKDKEWVTALHEGHELSVADSDRLAIIAYNALTSLLSHLETEFQAE